MAKTIEQLITENTLPKPVCFDDYCAVALSDGILTADEVIILRQVAVDFPDISPGMAQLLVSAMAADGQIDRQEFLLGAYLGGASEDCITLVLAKAYAQANSISTDIFFGSGPQTPQGFVDSILRLANLTQT